MRPFVSASRRTDILAWYTPWFMARIRAGFCQVANPFRPSQMTTVDLRPEAVSAIVFWTRRPRPIIPHLSELTDRGLNFVFHVTITGLPLPFEPSATSEKESLEAVDELARIIGPDRVWWRYDPIILSDVLNPAWHRQTFSRLATTLAGKTHRVTMSLIDWYRKTERRLALLESRFGPFRHAAAEDPDVVALAADLAGLARSHNIEPVACCEPAWHAAGIASGACIDAAALNQLFNLSTDLVRDPGQRPLCGCAPSYDIGANHTCLGGCLYCYATSSHARAETNHATHNPDSPVLSSPITPVTA